MKRRYGLSGDELYKKIDLDESYNFVVPIFRGALANYEGLFFYVMCLLQSIFRRYRKNCIYADHSRNGGGDTFFF
jgi:hypothetical protein